MHKVYITGSAIISAIGNNKAESVANIKRLDESGVASLKSAANFYNIKKSFKTQQEKFYSILESTVKAAIVDAKLSAAEAQDLHIFLGSTSMNITINEEAHLDFIEGRSEFTMKEVGFGVVGDFVEGLINAKHQATILQSACTSSANGLTYAFNLIRHGKIKRALVIGVEVFNKATSEGFNSLMLLSPSGECRPFDKDSDGIILGEACSAVILDSTKSAPDNFECLAANTSFDNYSITNSHPEGNITFDCMKLVLEKANLKLEDITILKAHSTGTPSSSLSEALAIEKLFEFYGRKVDVVALKPFIGHSLGACGTSEIVLLCECIKSGFIPKTFGFNEAYDGISFEMLTKKKEVRGATILFNSIGFGGSNNSIILRN